MKTYRIAFVGPGNQTWDIVDKFQAENDEDANAFAEIAYRDEEWYVLDAAGNNING